MRTRICIKTTRKQIYLKIQAYISAFPFSEEENNFHTNLVSPSLTILQSIYTYFSIMPDAIHNCPEAENFPTLVHPAHVMYNSTFYVWCGNIRCWFLFACYLGIVLTTYRWHKRCGITRLYLKADIERKEQESVVACRNWLRILMNTNIENVNESEVGQTRFYSQNID